ncbi:uncharacterized protein [Panulirus ornatus]|uniref:uncharacterized protein n=1 Tax=Panulirus ornatus TaxID=150431 RepID=UPI003A88BBD7
MDWYGERPWTSSHHPLPGVYIQPRPTHQQCSDSPPCIMKALVFLGVIAASLAAPVPDDCETVQVLPGALPYAGFGLAGHGIAGLAGHGIAPLAAAAPLAHVAAAPAIAPLAAAPAIAPLAAAAAPFAHVAAAPAIAPLPAAPIAPLAHPVAYAAPQPVALPPAEVKIPITRTHVEVPVHQQVHYGTQAYVAGATTHIHKPALAAPAIAPPTTLLSKVTHNPAEVTIKHQEIPVERHTPNFVETPYHAGTIIEYTEPEVREVKVPTPYAKPVPVPQPVPVAQPVPVPTPVHSVAVHHAAPVVAPVAAPVVASVAAPVAYGAVLAADDC